MFEKVKTSKQEVSNNFIPKRKQWANVINYTDDLTQCCQIPRECYIEKCLILIINEIVVLQGL